MPNSSVNYSITGTVTSTYACVRGRRLADKLDPLSVNFDRRFTLPASGRGIVGQTVEIEEPDPEVGSCRAEGKTVLYQVEYDDVNIHDLTNGVEAVIGGGTFSLIFCDLNKNPQNCPPPS